MSNCHKCYWADRDPKTGIQAIHKEPDYLNPNMKAGTSPPDIRIVQSCAEGASYFKSFGRQDHNCNKFVDESEQQEADQEEIDAKRKTWTHPTSRLQLPSTQNIMLVIEKMGVGNNKAFDILLELMATYGDELPAIITHLDDMNIRGAQIVLAYEFGSRSVDELVTNARSRNPKMVAYVNQKYPKAKQERAVERGAHLYGHKSAKKLVKRK